VPSDNAPQSGLRDRIRLRHPAVRDGLAIWHLIGEAGTLDQNSTYAYLAICRDFADTCVVAEPADVSSGAGQQLYGFVTGYLPPRQPDALFIWQIGVAPAARGAGLAGRMLQHLLLAPACHAVSHLITNVTPSNAASRALFHGLARRLDARLEEEDGFDAGLFPEPGHEPERLLRIGPFDPRRLAATD
jgi:L-2,4-diaminobutyric acid acetyltransferase